MIGFLTGVGANIILGQLPDLTGVEAEGGSSIAKALDVILHPALIDIPSLLTGLAAIAILVVLGRTPFLLLLDHRPDHPDLAVAGGRIVARVEDVGDIPQGFPVPALPQRA